MRSRGYNPRRSSHRNRGRKLSTGEEGHLPPPACHRKVACGSSGLVVPRIESARNFTHFKGGLHSWCVSLRSRWVCVLAALFVFCGLAGSAFAQTDVTTSRISGTVEDSSKSPLPGVTVEATNTETGLQQVEVTDANGFYRILNLPTGTYTVTATLDGFATATAESVRLLLGSTPTVNFTLQSARGLGDHHGHRRGARWSRSTNTQIGTTIQSEQIKNLPSPGRDFKQLVLLTPETPPRLRARQPVDLRPARHQHQHHRRRRGLQQRLLRRRHGRRRGPRPALASPQESIKEFSVITNGASVEFGRSGGGFVNVITKSGTNNLHGSGFYYNQPQSLISDFAKGQTTATSRPTRTRSSTAPRWAGRSSSDQLFYFVSYDKQKQDVTVPIAATCSDPRHLRQVPGALPRRPASRRPRTARSPSAASTGRRPTPTASRRAATSPSTMARTAPPTPRAAPRATTASRG